MNGNNNIKDSETRTGVLSYVVQKQFSRNISTSLRPFQALSFDLTRSQSSDMRDACWKDVLTSFNPGTPLSKTQQISTSFNPTFFSWLTNTIKYSANYQWSDNPQMKSKGTGQSSRVSTNFTISGSFNPQKFVGIFKKKSSRGGRTRRRPRRPVTRNKPEQQAEEGKKEEETKEKKPFFLLSALSFLGKGFEKIDPISISITETKSAQNYGILGTPSLEYQLGFTLDPGVDYSESVTQRPSTKEDHRLSIRSGLKITANLTAKFDYEYSSSSSQSTQTSGNISRSTLLTGDKGIPFPNWTVQWRGLEKLPLISKVARTVSFNHGFSGKMTENWSDSPDNVTQQTISRDFRPLIGMSMTMKNGLTANVQYSTTEEFSEQKKYGTGQTKRISTNINISANYNIRGGFKIPFLGGKKLDNNIDISITYTKSDNTTFQKKGATEDFTKTALTKNWSLQPKITYTFTRTVRGGINLELGEREDLRMGKTKITGFGINAVISLAGR
jgi:hypothetical protein